MCRTEGPAPIPVNPEPQSRVCYPDGSSTSWPILSCGQNTCAALPPCSGEEQSCCCCLKLVEGPQPSNGLGGRPTCPRGGLTSPEPTPLWPREGDAFPQGPPQCYSEGPDCSIWWPSVTPRAAPKDSVGMGDNLSPTVILGCFLLSQAWDPSQQ